MLIIAGSFPFVKNFTVSQVLTVTLFVYRHKRNNRILEILGISICSDSQNKLIPLAVDLQMLQDICGVGHVRFNDIVRCMDNFGELLHDSCRNIWMPFADMLKLLVGDNYMPGSNG